ncbi:MAG: DMT family transporter [Pyramidobacter sp.]|nr:DMT family transporter [Pyramidobacter sp.]
MRNLLYLIDLYLLLVTAFWGASYYLTDVSLTDLPPMCLNAFRFLSAFIMLGIMFHKTMRALNRETIRYSFWVGLALAATYIFYGYGISRTSLSNAAFICAISVAFTPLFSYLFERAKPTKKIVFCILLCVVGVGFLTLGDDLRPAVGDIICLGAPVCYALDIAITDKAVRRSDVDPLGLGVCQLGVVGAITLTMSLILEQPHLPTTPATWASSLFLGFFCSGAAFVIQAVQQKHTTANHVGLIFTMEPVFATVIAFFFAGEVITTRSYFGMALMLISLIFMEIDWPAKQKEENAA